MKNNTLSKAMALFFVLLMIIGTSWSQTVTIESRPAQVDATDATSQSAVFVTLANYPTDDVRYRLYSGSTFHYVWNGTEFVTSTSYSENPLVPGTATTSTSWWIIYQAGTNLTGVSNYRDRQGPEYTSNNLTQALPEALPIVTSVAIPSADVAFAYTDFAAKHVVLAYDSEVNGTLISATSTDLTTGDFTLVVEEGTTIQRIELRSVDNSLLESKTGVWPAEPEPFTTLFATLPAYFGASTERGFAVDANNVYVASRNAGTFIKVHDRQTGAINGDLNTTGVSGGTFPLNDLEVTEDGLILGINLTTSNAASIKIYSFDAVNAPVVLIEYPLTDFATARFGDKFTVVGSSLDGTATIYAADGSAKRLLKWTMNDDGVGGFEFGDPQIITLDIPDGTIGTPVVTPKPDGTFFFTSSGRGITKHNAEGINIGAIPTTIVATSSTAMKYLGTDGNDDYLAVYQFGDGNENLRVVRLPGGDPAAAEIVFITPSVYTTFAANGNGTGDVAFVPNPAKVPGEVDLYVMGTNNGVGGYTSVGLNIEPPVYEILVPPVYARAQIIHNSADAAAASVDVFVNGALFYGGLDFREATPFVDVPAGVDLTIDIAPAGAGIGASVFNLANVQFIEDETYVIVASGIVSATGYDPLTPFSLEVFAGARETAAVATEVDLLVYHGATDAPGVNVDARYVGNLVSNAEYTDFAGYLNVPAAYYTLDIAAFAAPDDILISFGADLRTLDGSAATVIASGFLDPSVNSNGAGFALLAVLADGTVLELPVAVEYEFELSGLLEVPSNLSAGTGSGMLTLAGSVAQLSGTFSGLGNTYTASHIHIAATGSNGGVAHALTPELDVDQLGGTYDPLVNTFDFSQDNIDKLIAGELYVNIHSTDYPPGEIRGQLLSSPNTAPTASAITAPAEAAELTIEGDPATPFVPTWDVAADVDGDLVAYIWQLAADDAFANILVNVSTGTATQFETDFETVDAILDGAGVAVGESITVYHRAVSTDGSAITYGATASVVLTRGDIAGFAITEFPWSETFEADSWSRPEWTQIQEVGTASWTFAAGSSGGSILTAYEGALNARFVSGSGTNSPVTKLVTPLLDLTSLTTPRIAFWYGQQDWFGDQNELKVYYRIAPDQPWVEIAHFTDNVSVWTKATIALPEPSATYQIALEGINNYGRANVIDLFTVEESPTLFNVTFNVVDELAAPIADAVITLDGNANAAGEYLFEEIEPGTYDYTVVAPLFNPYEGEVTIVDADVAVDVTLEAGVPELAAAPDTLFVGWAVNGLTTNSAVVTISNAGYAPAVVEDGDISFTGANAADFTFTLVDELLTYPITLDNGEGFDVEVTFTPTSVVEADAQLVVASNAAEDLVIVLEAVGYDPLTEFFEDFNNYEIGAVPSPLASIVATASTGSYVDISNIGSPYSAPYHARIANGSNATGTALLISPMVTDLDVSWLRFFAKMSSSTTTDNLEVGYMTDPTDAATFVLVGSVSVTGAYQQFSVSFADVAEPASLPENAYIAFRHAFSATFRIYHIDDVTYEAKPATAILGVNKDEVNFGVATYINELSTQQIIVTNTGIGTLTLEEADFSISGADAAFFGFSFPEGTTFPVELESLESLVVNITFEPTEEIAYTASLDIDDILGMGITSVPLSGTGYDPTVVPDVLYDFVGVFPPLDWANRLGILSDTTELTPGALWVHTKFANVASLPANNATKMNIWSNRDGWMVTPPINLGDGSTPYMLSFDMALTGYNNTNPATLGAPQSFSVVISTDNGATWVPANILRQWTSSDAISNTGQNEVIDLGSYSGIVRLGFYGKSTTSADVDLHLTNVAVVEAVYQTVTFNVADADANPITDASVTFNGETLAAAPYVFDAVEGTYDYEVVKDGYLTDMGMVTVGDVAVEVDVTLTQIFTVDFTVTDFDTTPIEGATITITGAGDAELLTDVDGMAAIDLANGVYDVVVSAQGYVDASLQITVDGAPVSEEVTLSDELVAPYNLMVDLDGNDALFSWNTPMSPGIFSDSFEDGTLDAWFATVQGAGTPGESGNAYWYIAAPDGGLAAPDGSLVAKVNWGYNIDTWMISPLLLVEENTSMSFQWNSSYYWSVDPNPNAELMIKVSADGENWTEIWNWQDIGVWVNWTWYETILDLSAYAGQELHFALHLVANDNGNTQVDDVYFGPAGKAGTYMASVVPQGVKEDSRVNTFVATEKALIDYTVILNGAEIATGLTETNYQFTDLPFGTHTAGVAANYSSDSSDTTYIDFTILLPAVDPLPMATLYDATGANLPTQIGTGGNARSAALYQDRYVIVPSREVSPQVWAFDIINPHLDPIALDMGTDLIVGGLFAVNYVEVVGDNIYVSNMSLGSDAAHPFRVYRWSSLDAAPELVLSSNGGWGRLGDAFTIIGDPAADGSIVAHINSDPGENALRRKFRKWNFVGGVLQNQDTPEMVEVTLPDGLGTMNSFGVMKPIEGETDKFLVTSNAIGMTVVNGAGNTLAYVGTDVFPSRTMDPNIFYFNGNRYLSFVVNKETELVNGDFTGAYYQVVDITLGATVEEAISLISTTTDLMNRTVHFGSLGDGAAFLSGTNRVVKSGDDLMILSHVVARGFKLVTSGAALTSFALTVEAAPVEGGTATGGGDFYEGATAPVTATPAEGYQFVNWTVGGTAVSTEAEFNYTMPAQATTLVANFETVPVIEVATLAALRALPADGTVYNYTGNAVVVAQDGYRNRKFLQDATAAIVIDDFDGIITTQYDLYDVVSDVIGTTTVFRNMLQFVPQENTAEATENTPVDPTVFTLDDVTQDDQAKYVKFMNVTFVGIEPDSLFANGTNYTVTDGTNNFVVRTDFWNTDLLNTEIPTDPVNISGVVITFNETLQLVPRFLADIETYVSGFAVTFNVDMTPATGFDPDADIVYITGDLLGWAGPGSDPDNQTMTRVAESMIWTKTLYLEAGTYQYKYFINAGWDGGEWPGEPNRSITIDGDVVINNVWGVNVNVDELANVNLNIFPNPAREQFSITTSSVIRNLVISDITGKVVYTDIINDSQVRIQESFETGMYILHIHTDEGVIVRKLQIQK